MKIAICNVPLRSDKQKTNYPPLGALAVIQALIFAGYQDVIFYDVNVFRYSNSQIKEYFFINKFDLVGISATISTSYRFVKTISQIIRSVSEDTVIVVGGAITASSKILLRFTEVDYCVIGEGEKIIVNLANYVSFNGKKKLNAKLKEIKGICYLNEQKEAVFTGYEEQLSVAAIQDADYSLIEKFSKVENYIIDPFFYDQFKFDQRSFEKHRKSKRLATVVTSRGCVNRCTFCHRWQKGIRVFPVDRVISYIQVLMERYNVGFISIGDEDFGASKKWVEDFINKIKPLDILYRISGICADNVNPEMLRALEHSGCVAVHYGFESGSNRILRVMEKRADVELNVQAAKWTYEAGLQTVCAFVVGMPGESFATIRETTHFAQKVTEFLPREPIISVNKVVVLPGAPIYEYARYRGLLGRTLEEEESYLLRVSDQGGGSSRQLNLTDYPYFIVQSWIHGIHAAVRYNYRRMNNGGRWPSVQSFLRYNLRYFFSLCIVILKNLFEDKKLFFERFIEFLIWPIHKKIFREYVALRNYLNEKFNLVEIPQDSIEVLRLGR